MNKIVGLILSIFFMEIYGQPTVDPDCIQPPPFVDPHTCCKDPGPNEVAKKCAKKYDLPIPGEVSSYQNLPRPNVEATVCFADCVLTEAKFISKGTFDKNAMETDIRKEYAKDPAYSEVMIAAFETCAASANQKMEAIKKMPLSDTILNGKCSPYAGIILGCAYTEYFKNCPVNRWIQNPGCDTARNYVKKCVI